MSYQGMMDGWQGDESLCQGSCGLCDDCDERYYQASDDAFDAWRNEEAA